MPIGIDYKQLIRAIGANAARLGVDSLTADMSFPGVHIVDQQRKVIPPVMRNNLFFPLADQVQFLIAAESKPGTRKGEIRSGQRFELQDVAIEGQTFVEIGNVESDVVEGENVHGRFSKRQPELRMTKPE